MMYAEPQALHALLDKLAKSVTLYLNAQIKAGAQSVMIFDTWGGVLTGRDYQQFSLYYIRIRSSMACCGKTKAAACR